MSFRSLHEAAIHAIPRKHRRPPPRLSPSGMVAKALIVRGLRKAGLHHPLQNVPCTIGIVGVDEGSVDAVSMAARDILGAWIVANFGYDVVVHDRTAGRRKGLRSLRSIVIEAAKGGERGAVLFATRKDVSDAFIASAEGVVVLDPVDRAVLKGAFMSYVKRSPEPEDLDLIATLPLGLIDSVIAQDRSVARCVGIAKRLLAAIAAESLDTATDAGNAAQVQTTDGPRLEDMSGLGEVGEWGSDLVRDLGDYRAGAISWTDVDRGVLIAGPPGVGKTMFAGALARSCGVPIHVHSCARWQARGHLGDLLKAMAAAFNEARKTAPCILFLDEMDAFGSRTDPGDQYAAYSRQVIDGLLEHLDGAAGREGVVVVGATNHPDLIDPAIMRPGRLERIARIEPPDENARRGILKHHLRAALEGTDLGPIAERLDGATGADIELLVRRARRAARKARREMVLADLSDCLLPEAAPSSELLWRACVHEAGHLVVGTRLASVSGCRPVIAKVQARGQAVNVGETVFEREPGGDVTKDSLMAEIAVLLAGTAAEELLIGSRGVGAGGPGTSDLVMATNIAKRIEAVYGLGTMLRAVDQSELMHGDSDRHGLAVERILRACMSEASAILGAEKPTLLATARVLSATGVANCPVSNDERSERVSSAAHDGATEPKSKGFVRERNTFVAHDGTSGCLGAAAASILEGEPE